VLPEKAGKGASSEDVDAITGVVNLRADSYAARAKHFELIWSEGIFN
jgi:hypothetical protein